MKLIFHPLILSECSSLLLQFCKKEELLSEKVAQLKNTVVEAEKNLQEAGMKAKNEKRRYEYVKLYDVNGHFDKK